MTEIIGMLNAWCAKDFILPALEQAVEYCDEVMVCCAPHSKLMESFDDGTANIAKLFASQHEKVTMIEVGPMSHHAIAKANILNTMIAKSKLAEPGNWIWVLDADEFYPARTYKYIRELTRENTPYDRIDFEEWYFYINMHWCLGGEHLRMFKIKNFTDIFQPTQRWVYANNPFKCDRYSLPMFHYGMLTNPWAKMEFWSTEYPGKNQTNKIRWLDEIYRNYDLNNQEACVEANMKLCGIYSPWFSDSFQPTMEGTLYQYDDLSFGPHPKFINSDLIYTEDYRAKYHFYPDRNLTRSE